MSVGFLTDLVCVLSGIILLAFIFNSLNVAVVVLVLFVVYKYVRSNFYRSKQKLSDNLSN